MKRFKKQYGCPVELAIDVLNGKWKTVILARLKEGPHRYGELRARIFGMSDKVLTERLRDLEQLGFIKGGLEGTTQKRPSMRSQIAVNPPALFLRPYTPGAVS